MSKKKAIDCPKILGGCGSICKEVGHAISYPKLIHETRVIAKGKPTEREINGHEYRYTCPNCGKEWIHDTLSKVIYEIKSAQFHIELINGKELYKTKDLHICKHYGLKPGKKYTSEEIKEHRKMK